MTDAAPTRPNYFDGEFLDADDFTTEQQYHLSMLRRHQIAHHTAGTVTGLAIAIDGDTGIPFVGPGFGIDPFGRSLIVTERLPLGGDLFPPGGPDAYDVVLLYDRIAGGEPPGAQWIEQPRATLVAPTGPGAGPPMPSSAVAAFGPTDDPPDDPAQQAPLFLGQLRRPDKNGDPPIVDQSGRPYVELNASAVTAAQGTARLELAASDGPFALYAGTDPAELRRRLALSADGQLAVAESLTVDGKLTLGTLLQLQPADPTDGWGVQLVNVTDPKAGPATELRVQMGSATGSQPRRTVIGAWQGGSFKPLLTIREAVEVSGDMVVNGTVQATGGIVPSDLSSQASAYATSAMSSGIGATSALVDKVTSGAFTPFVPPTPPTSAAVKQTTSQLVTHLNQDPVAHAESFAQELKAKGEHLIQPLINALQRL